MSRREGWGCRGPERPLRGTGARNERRKWKQEGKDGRDLEAEREKRHRDEVKGEQGGDGETENPADRDTLVQKEK